MLPNHAPLVIAEQFGTLARCIPGRIDLGLGRAPGTDQITARALRRDCRRAPTVSRRTCSSCRPTSRRPEPDQAVQAVPGAGTDVPIWILGSSTYGAQLAAALGLPYAFASHFAPDAADAGARDLPHAVPAVGAARKALRDGRRQRRRRRDRPRGEAAWPRRSRVVHQHVPRQTRPEPAADRRHRDLLVARREGAGDADAGMFHRRLARHRARRACGIVWPRPGRTS